jgi:4-alpha-glucanotransferase
METGPRQTASRPPRRAGSENTDLRRLAAFLGIQPSYIDVVGRRRFPPPEAISAVAVALAGRPPGEDFGATLRRLEAERSESILPPVAVAWLPGHGSVALSARPDSSVIECELESETGSVLGWRTEATPDARGRPAIALPNLLPGYYHLHVRFHDRKATCLVIVAPRRAYRRAGGRRDWGAFLPLYALYSARSWGIGDFSDLARLGRYVKDLGGSTLATLPLLASFLDDRILEPSPYSPASRLMWNEAYVDVTRLPGFDSNASVRRFVASPDFREDLAACRAGSFVDYLAVARLKRRVMLELSAALSEAERQELETFLDQRPEVGAYARFRALSEHNGAWHGWKSTEQLDFDPAAEGYHRYAQWVAEKQIAELSGPKGEGADLYLDLPVGVNAAGYDTWRWPAAFLSGVSAGAPPDAFFRQGQVWDFPPLHPSAIRDQRYEYVIAFVRHNLGHAFRLRIDHVMGFHRLFCIPAGFEAGDGVYVRYRADEMYAILSLESHRSQTELVGENLGVVPRYVNRRMSVHGLSGLYVLPFQVQPGRRPAIPEPPADNVASLDTHDTPTFAAWWLGDDIEQREGLGYLSSEQVQFERQERQRVREAVVDTLRTKGFLSALAGEDASAVRDSLYAFLGASPSPLVLLNLEDLWGETEPQNIPGTVDEHPNWRRKARLSLEEIESTPAIAACLKAIAAARPQERHQD